MQLERFDDDYAIWESDGHGKTGKGYKKTTGIQVRQYMPGGGYILMNTFNFPIGNKDKRDEAIAKARACIKSWLE